MYLQLLVRPAKLPSALQNICYAISLTLFGFSNLLSSAF